MKVNFNRSALAEALGLLVTIIPSRTPKPILRCVKISANEKEVKLFATDLEVGIQYSLSEVQVEESGETVIPADKLAAIVRESTDEVLGFSVDEGTCTIKGVDSCFTVYCHQPEQFPSMPELDGDEDIKVALESLQEGIDLCLFATAKESSRYAINGMLWEVKGKKLFLVATDGRRLARCKVNLSEVSNEKFEGAKIIVPAKTMALLDKVGGAGEDIVGIKMKDNQILVSCANVIINSILVEGNFPKYEDIIPTSHDKKLVLSTEASLSAVRRAALLTSEESRGIKISIDKGRIKFSGRAPEAGDAQVEMSTDYKGEPLEVGFNPQFLVDVLRFIKTAEFELELGQADMPGLIKSGKNFIYVLMPINLG